MGVVRRIGIELGFQAQTAIWTELSPTDPGELIHMIPSVELNAGRVGLHLHDPTGTGLINHCGQTDFAFRGREQIAVVIPPKTAP